MIEFTEGFEKLLAKIAEMGEIPNLALPKIAKHAADQILSELINNLQPVGGAFLPHRKSSKGDEYHPGGYLKSILFVKKSKSIKGKAIYHISTTWYAKFKDKGFTARNGKFITGGIFLTETMNKMRPGLIGEMQVELIENIKKVCEK